MTKVKVALSVSIVIVLILLVLTLPNTVKNISKFGNVSKYTEDEFLLVESLKSNTSVLDSIAGSKVFSIDYIKKVVSSFEGCTFFDEKDIVSVNGIWVESINNNSTQGKHFSLRCENIDSVVDKLDNNPMYYEYVSLNPVKGYLQVKVRLREVVE